MAVFENFPYTNAHELNLDWIIKVVKEYVNKTDELEVNIEDLKEYVNNYFENLDVQEEINNKLQDMYDSGQLAVLIAQFLNTNSLLVFNTTADLIAGTEFIDGSTVIKLGDLLYNDGKTALYKIRIITSSDVVDGVKIIALSNFPTLIAELLENYYIKDLQEKSIKHVDFEYSDISFKRYDYDTYLIDVIKLNRTNQDGSINTPVVNGTSEATDFYDLSKNSMIACNGSFFNQSNDHLVGNILAEGELITGDPVSSSMSSTCYMAIDDEGQFIYYDRNTDLNNLPSNIKNVIMAWCPLIQNGAVSSYIKEDNETTQQQIGYDDDMNYYIITTTYKCPLTYRNMADWIIENIPNANTFYAMDSGGSTQTTIADVRTNLETDLTLKNGRRVTGCVYFKTKNTGNLNVLSNIIRINQENNNIQKIFSKPNGFQIASGVTANYSAIYQKGNIVFGNISFTVSSGASIGPWIDITNVIPLPNPDETVFFTSIANEPTHQVSRLNITKNNTQIQTATTIEIRFSATGTYDYTILYATKQNS